MAKHSSTKLSFWEIIGTPSPTYSQPDTTLPMVDVRVDYHVPFTEVHWWRLLTDEEWNYQNPVWLVWQDGNTPHWRQLEA